MFWKREEPKRIKDINKTNGIFKWLLLAGYILPPWDTGEKAIKCDRAYYYHSSMKIISDPIQEDIFENNDYSYVAWYIWNIYGMKWESYWNALTKEYDILKSDDTESTILKDIGREYTKNEKNEKFLQEIKSILEKINNAISSETNQTTNEKNNSNNDSNIISKKHNNTEATKDTIEVTNDDIYGFNSDSSSSSNDKIINNRNTDKSNNFEDSNGSFKSTEFNNSDTSLISNNKETNNSNRQNEESLNNQIIENRKEDGNESITDDTRKTNSGRTNRSPQSLIEEELELRKKIFLDIVYGDIDNLITIQVY